MRHNERCHEHRVRAVDRTDVRQRLHSPAPVREFAAIQVAPQAGRAEDHQSDTQVLFRHMHFIAHDRSQVCVEHVAGGRAAHHVEHAQLDTTVEEQAELRQEADFHDVAVARQRHDHTDDEHNGEHIDHMERPTPTERVGHPCADRHAHHGCDGEAGEHPCDEFRTESVRCHIGHVRHSHSHQRSGYQGDHDARHHQNRVIGCERAQEITGKEYADQRQMSGESREPCRQRRAERRDGRVHEGEQGHQIADRHLRYLQIGCDVGQDAHHDEFTHAKHETRGDQDKHRKIEEPFLCHAASPFHTGTSID